MPLEINKMDLFDTCGVSEQDLDALKLAECLQSNEVEGCDMHNDAKIGRSAIGDIVWTRNKESINPFQESVKLIEHFQVISTMLINNHANRIIRRNDLVQNPDMPKIVIKRDLNKTRISARQLLLDSTLRIKRGL